MRRERICEISESRSGIGKQLFRKFTPILGFIPEKVVSPLQCEVVDALGVDTPSTVTFLDTKHTMLIYFTSWGPCVITK